MEATDFSEIFLATDDNTDTHLKGSNTNPVIFYVHSVHALYSRDIL